MMMARTATQTRPLTISERADALIDLAPRMFASLGNGKWAARSTSEPHKCYTIILRGRRADGTFTATCNCRAHGHCIHLELAGRTVFPQHFATLDDRDLSAIESQATKSQLFREPEEVPARYSLMDHLRLTLIAEVA
jgi:hypothetical protein